MHFLAFASAGRFLTRSQYFLCFFEEISRRGGSGRASRVKNPRFCLKKDIPKKPCTWPFFRRAGRSMLG
jgi:hypothetical protein